MIRAEIVADSISPAGKRITTFLLDYPRMIHSEFMTHRAVSKNASSSRAIPFGRMVRMIRENPAMPIKWGTHQKGMQSGAEDAVTAGIAKEIWLSAMDEAIRLATLMDSHGIHKSITNRLLEPFAHMRTLATATEWENFYGLRVHPAAQPEFDALAFAMLCEQNGSTPRVIPVKGWHIPFCGDLLDNDIDVTSALEVATARCARTSYMPVDGTDPDIEKDRTLHNRLAADGHWSPFEHCAQALPDASTPSGNFRGWHQYRKTFPFENISGIDLLALEVSHG